MRLRSKYIVLAFFLLFLFVFYLFLLQSDALEYPISLSTSLWNYHTYQYIISDGRINSSFPITFYHEAFVDYRTSPPQLRVYALNPCLRKSNYIVIQAFDEELSDPTRMILKGSSMEERCPSMEQFSSPCFYAPHTFTAELLTTRSVEKVKILLGNREISLSVKEIPKHRSPGLTVCLQPVYYYVNWQNILLYIEAWKAQGATNFIVFYHSGTKETQQVLDYYQKQGVIEYRPWPSFGSHGPNVPFTYPKFDDSVFIYSYYLAMNICILEIKTSLGIIADFDEVMVTHKNQSVFDYAQREMTGTNVGALRFEANHVAMSPSIYTNDFSGVSKPRFYRRYGAPKHIFNSSSIDIAQVHYIRSFLEPKVTKPANGITLHFRYKAELYPKMADKPFGFFPNNTEEHVANINTTAHKIFNGQLPTFPSNLATGHSSCTYKYLNAPRNKYTVCMSKHAACKAAMDRFYDWVYDETKGVFLT